MASLGCRPHARWRFVLPEARCSEDPRTRALTYCGAGAGPSSWGKRCPAGMERHSPERRQLISLTGLILGTSSLKGNALVALGLEGF